MADGKFVAYYRVSTTGQGVSGLGLEAQREAVERYLNGGSWSLIEAFTEVETGKGSNALDRRPHVKAALAYARKHTATLVSAKLDRSRMPPSAAMDRPRSPAPNRRHTSGRARSGFRSSM